jgi:hypothetical protein
MPPRQPHRGRRRARPTVGPGPSRLGIAILVLIEIGNRADVRVPVEAPRYRRLDRGAGPRVAVLHGRELFGQQLEPTGDGGVVLGG